MAIHFLYNLKLTLPKHETHKTRWRNEEINNKTHMKLSNKTVAKSHSCLKYIQLVKYLYVFFPFGLSYKSFKFYRDECERGQRRWKKKEETIRRKNKYIGERWSGRVSIQLQRWISCLGGCTASNDREEIVTVFDTLRPIPPSPLAPLSLSFSHSFSHPLAASRSRESMSVGWEDSSVSVTIGWEWCTNTIHLLSSWGPDRGARGEWEGQSEECRRNFS